jgi:AraC family transcriptional regulator of adaptative response / DNA-3-methyladenine glycosylase II
LALAYRPPFDWAALLDYLTYRAIPGVESVHDGVYRRTIRIPGASALAPGASNPAILEVRNDAPARLLRVTLLPVHGAVETGSLLQVVGRLRRLFDLDADPVALAKVLGADPILAPLLAAHPGLRIPGAWDGFEVAVRAVLGQQVSVRAATTIAGRIATRCGERLAGDVELDRLFPDAASLAQADLTGLGLMPARVRTVQSLALAVADGAVRPESGAPAEPTKAALGAIRGIGAWTAEYVALRVLREPDAFPSSDLGLRRAYARLAASGTRTTKADLRPVTPAVLERAAAIWQPWRAYAAVYLWTWEANHASVDG